MAMKKWMLLAFFALLCAWCGTEDKNVVVDEDMVEEVPAGENADDSAWEIDPAAEVTQEDIKMIEDFLNDVIKTVEDDTTGEQADT